MYMHDVTCMHASFFFLLPPILTLERRIDKTESKKEKKRGKNVTPRTVVCKVGVVRRRRRRSGLCLSRSRDKQQKKVLFKVLVHRRENYVLPPEVWKREMQRKIDRNNREMMRWSKGENESKESKEMSHSQTTMFVKAQKQHLIR